MEKDKEGSTLTEDQLLITSLCQEDPRNTQLEDFHQFSASINWKKLLQDAKAKGSSQSEGVKCVLLRGEKVKHRIFASSAQWCFIRICVLRTITLKNIIRCHVTAFCNSESSTHI
jgi:hypothetical protein